MTLRQGDPPRDYSFLKEWDKPEPAVLLRDTPEDRERLIALAPDRLTPQEQAMWADAILAALREPRRYPESGEER